VSVRPGMASGTGFPLGVQACNSARSLVKMILYSQKARLIQ
jgi:hypothetical protein